MIPTEEQLAVREEFRTGRRHFVVRARAGTGKTTLIFDGVPYMPELKSGWVLYLAFNKKIERAATARNTRPDKTTILPKFEIKTVHSVGLRFIRRNWRNFEIDFEDHIREDTLTNAVCGSQVPEAIKRLVSKLHTKGREIQPHAEAPGDLIDLALQFDCEPDEMYANTSYDLAYVEARALEAMDLAAAKEPKVIDGSDMIFLPVRNKWLRPVWKSALVDEVQDLTPAQLEIATGISSGRLGLIGDDRQAIYQFRGAGAGSLDRLKAKLDAVEFPMTMTFRCGKKIVELAQTLVPDLQAAPGNPDGEVLEMAFEQLVGAAAAGDFILSRLNAPLMGIALGLLKAGKRAKINGTDIGKGLITLTRKIAKSVDDPVEVFMDRVVYWRDRQVARLISAKRQQRHIDAVNDKADMLLSLSEDHGTVADLISRLQTLFTDSHDDSTLTLCSSVHKAKGLEANRVFVLNDTLRNHNDGELNIQYVAWTRAKHTLVLVKGGV